MGKLTTFKCGDTAAKEKGEKGWFKRIDYGEDLGRLIIDDLPNLAGKETLRVLEQIEGWIYG